jgi:hypothetical protein
VKLYIAEVDGLGRSYIVSEEKVSEARAIHVWEGALDDDATALASHPASGHPAIEPLPGGVRWTYVRFPPANEAEAWGYKTMGFHRTRSIDFDHLLSGRLHCELDNGTVKLEAGDFLILRGANHRWVNPGDTVATLLCLLHKPKGV